MIPAEPGQRLSRTPGGFPAAPFQKGDDSRAGSCSRLRVCGKRLSSSRCAVLPMAARFPPGVLSEGRPRERATAAPGSHPAGPAASNSTRPRTSGRRAQPPVVVGAPCSCREGVDVSLSGGRGGGAAKGARGGFLARECAHWVCGFRTGLWRYGALGGSGPCCACW